MTKNGEWMTVDEIPDEFPYLNDETIGGTWITRDSYEWQELSDQFPEACEEFDSALVGPSKSKHYTYSRAYFIEGIIPYLDKICWLYYGRLGVRCPSR